MVSRKLYTLLLCFSVLTGCTHQEMYENSAVKEAQVTDRTRATQILADLPAPTEKTVVALYDFQDQTGQFKNNDKYTDYSSAVTKGGHAILTKALLDAGNKQWFTVIERGGLKDLLQERQIIKVMRGEYNGNGQPAPQLPPLLYGGMLIEGGIISYDSNIITGGAGAIYLGIGGNAQYHRDLVTVALRAINVQTGEVVLSVTSSKTLYSVAWDTNVLKYITYDRLLQAEAGFTSNEPTQLAVRQALETAVYSLIMEGAIDKLWDFKDPVAGKQAIAQYLARRDGPPPAQVAQQPSDPKWKINDRVAAVEPIPAATAAPVQPVTLAAAEPSTNSTNVVPMPAEDAALITPAAGSAVPAASSTVPTDNSAVPADAIRRYNDASAAEQAVNMPPVAAQQPAPAAAAQPVPAASQPVAQPASLATPPTATRRPLKDNPYMPSASNDPAPGTVAN